MIHLLKLCQSIFLICEPIQIRKFSPSSETLRNLQKFQTNGLYIIYVQAHNTFSNNKCIIQMQSKYVPFNLQITIIYNIEQPHIAKRRSATYIRLWIINE
jgi:hypothetical protein